MNNKSKQKRSYRSVKLLWNAIIFIQCYSCLIQQKEGTDCEKMRGWWNFVRALALKCDLCPNQHLGHSFKITSSFTSCKMGFLMSNVKFPLCGLIFFLILSALKLFIACKQTAWLTNCVNVFYGEINSHLNPWDTYLKLLRSTNPVICCSSH